MSIHLVTGHAGRNHVDAGSVGLFNCAIFSENEYSVKLDNYGGIYANTISNNKVRISEGNLIMQGRHVSIVDHEDVDIENGASGYYRHDLIVARYELNEADSTESCVLSVLKGTPSTSYSGAKVPEHTSGQIFGGDTVNEMPLFDVFISGLTISRVTPVFKEITSIKEQIEDLDNRKLEANKDINAENHRIFNVSTPSMNKDAANKVYVDDSVKKVSDNVGTISEKLSGVSKIQCGTASIDFSTSSKGSSVSVTFPTAFATVPSVVVQQVFDNANIVVQQADISTTGFTAYLQQMTSSGTRSFSWIAIA